MSGHNFDFLVTSLQAAGIMSCPQHDQSCMEVRDLLILPFGWQDVSVHAQDTPTSLQSNRLPNRCSEQCLQDTRSNKVVQVLHAFEDDLGTVGQTAFEIPVNC